MSAAPPYHPPTRPLPSLVSPELGELRFDTLARQPQWLETLALWHHQQWPEESLACRREKLTSHLVPERLPLTLLLLSEKQLLASGSLVVYSRLGGYPESLWLANVMVDEPWRHRGLGRLMVTALQRLARRQPFPELYLSTTDRLRFYQLLGWEPFRQREVKGQMTHIMRFTF